MERNKILQIIALATGLSFVQMFICYILLALKLFGKYNVFLAYRKIFEETIIFNKLYFLFVNIMHMIFGLSYPYVIGFNNVFKLTFFTIFITNIAFLFFLFLLLGKERLGKEKGEEK